MLVERYFQWVWPWKTWWKQREIMFIEMKEEGDVTYSKHASFISRKWKDNQFSWTWANEFFVMAFLMSFWIGKTFRKSTLKRRITCELWDITNSNIHQYLSSKRNERKRDSEIKGTTWRFVFFTACWSVDAFCPQKWMIDDEFSLKFLRKVKNNFKSRHEKSYLKQF